MDAIIIPPPSGEERPRHGVLGRGKRHYLSNPNPHFASLELESLFIRCVELHPESTNGVLDICYDWLCTVANREGQPPWVLLEGVTGAQGSNLRAIVGEDQIKKKCVNVLRLYREPQRFRDARDKLQRMALASNVVATAVNNANALTREDGEPADGIDYRFSSVLVVDNDGGNDDGLLDFGGANNNGDGLGDHGEDPPAAAPPQGWKKMKLGFIISALLCFSVSCGAAIMKYATSNLTSSKRTTAQTDYTDNTIDSSMNSSIFVASEGSNVTSPPLGITKHIQSLIKMVPLVINGYTLDDDEEEDTNGTSSIGFSYTVESIATEVSSHSQLFMDNYIYNLDTPSMMFMVDVINPSFVDAEVVDFVCMDIRECGDIRRSAPLYLFTRDVSCPAATNVTTEEKVSQILATIETLEAEDHTVYNKVLAFTCMATFVGALYIKLSSSVEEDDEGDDEEVGDGVEQSALDADDSPEAPIRDQRYLSSPGLSRFVEAMLRG